ncbi:MAG: glycosyltransferase family 4 protein [Pyrinomonadaceae bacterium]
MKVLVGMPQPGSWGGPVGCEPPFVWGLRQIGVEVDEEVYVYGDQLKETVLWHRVERVVRTALRLRRRIKAVRYDLIHLNTAFDTKAVLRDTVTLFLLPVSGKRIFLKMHGSDQALLGTNNRVLRFLSHRLVRKTAGIGALSSEERQNFVRSGFNAEQVFVVKNVVDKHCFQTDADFAAHHGLAANTAALLFISRFITAKGLLDVIRACARVRDRGRTSFVLFCVGDGPARAEAEAEVAKLHLGDHVRFFGYLPEVEALGFYTISTMLVFPTYHEEGLPLVVLYSLAAGLPIITTRIRGAADYLREDDNCLWVAPRAPEDLADKIIHLLDDPHLRDRMKINNQQLARQFAPEHVAAEYLEIYKKVLSSSSSSSNEN